MNGKFSRFLKVFFVAIAEVLLLLVIGIAIGLFVPVHSTDTNIDHYDARRSKISYGDTFMPDLDSLGDCEDVRFIRRWTGEGFFEAETLGLFVRYSEVDYAQCKAQALDRSDFFMEPAYAFGYLTMMPSAEWQGYDLRAVDLTGDAGYACKQVGLVGTNDVERTICYLLFEDVDRDSLGREDDSPDAAMGKWLDKYFRVPRF